jgi:hypothetical protein
MVVSTNIALFGKVIDPMRILFAIPHYYCPDGKADAGRSYNSLAADPEPRVRALTSCLTALHSLFNAVPCFIHHGKRMAQQGRAATPCSLEVVICTTRGHHLLDRLPIKSCYYTHRATESESMLLGFECHAVLRERLGAYDYYCYLEDDLILHDPWFFLKLTWFNRCAGSDKILQPNRYEAALDYPVPKIYLDGDLDPGVTAVFQNIHDSGSLAGDVMGVPVKFERTLNPHSGCFFLTADQMAHWAGQRHFNDHDSRFIGPLETAATLGIMRTFRVYRACPANADFLEVQHAGTGYLAQLRPSAKEESP